MIWNLFLLFYSLYPHLHLLRETLHRDQQVLAVAADGPFCCCVFFRPDCTFVTLDLIQGYLYSTAHNQNDIFWFNTLLLDMRPNVREESGIVGSGERCSACKFYQEFMILCSTQLVKTDMRVFAIVHKPANKQVDCMLSASGTVTQATRPFLSRASLTTPAAGELAPSEEARDSILLRCARATLCSTSSCSDIPVGAS